MKPVLWGLASLGFVNATFMVVGYTMSNYQPNYVTIPLVLSTILIGVVGAILSLQEALEF